ncbi:DUF2147 domain-containing protein [Acinetobacter rongchengensis]|uniref:DUF2147 domain-containing protein n=1 Tax=Acinetobacter rongchengensis TaxID=2419601 RepID=A0A3A8EU84_9GAMM|nr:DUF2147 domain-containing protein [Acinetobacter rongchengensis]RKG38432.1 DUF2147 domain-containing protein [Acinetobacter rongchengensis]
MWTKFKFSLSIVMLSLSQFAFAEDISGLWQSIDDQTGAPKGIVRISKDANGTYIGTITKITPRVGYKPKEFCVNCPAPYTNKPIIGLNVIQGLKQKDAENYEGGKILDPNTGKIYSLKAKLSSNGKKLVLRGYIGIAALGRSQTWIRAY